jgi:hypothetical protein
MTKVLCTVPVHRPGIIILSPMGPVWDFMGPLRLGIGLIRITLPFRPSQKGSKQQLLVSEKLIIAIIIISTKKQLDLTIFMAMKLARL